MNIVQKNVNDLIPYAKNTKKHDRKQIANVAESIKQYGFVQPVVIDRDGVIVIGHCRVLGAKKLGMKEVPCVCVDDLTTEQVNALRIVDNKSNESDWDMDLLAEELPELDLSAFDFDFGIEEDEEVEIVEDEAPPVDEQSDPIAKLGDIWQLGRHRLMCGSSTDPEEVAELMDGVVADMCFTDPPYNCNYGNIKHPKFKARAIENDNMDTESFRNFCTDFTMNIKENVSGCVYMCAGQGQDGRVMFTVADELLHNSTTIIWNKDQFTLGRGKYQNKYEPIWFGWVESGKDFTDDRTLTNVWDMKRPKKSELHPTMKPVELVEIALKHNPRSKTVLDLFGGSGTTLMACEQMDRTCYMMELDPKYCDVIIKRWESFTGEKAVLLND
jgi:DNA modification methylase